MALDGQNQTNQQVGENQKEGPELALFEQRLRFVVLDGLWVESAKWLNWRLGSGFVCQSLAHELERLFEQNVVIWLLTELMVGTGHESHTFDLRGGL